jgi:hypothetical protein
MGGGGGLGGKEGRFFRRGFRRGVLTRGIRVGWGTRGTWTRAKAFAARYFLSYLLPSIFMMCCIDLCKISYYWGNYLQNFHIRDMNYI